MILKILLKYKKPQRNGFGLTNNERPHMGLGGITQKKTGITCLTSTFKWLKNRGITQTLLIIIFVYAIKCLKLTQLLQ